MATIIQNILTLVQEFTQVALSDPLSAVLITVGGLLTAFAAGAFGLLTVWGLADWVLPESESPPAQA